MTKHDWGTEVFLSPVYSDKPNSENKSFWDATPSGDIRMTIKNDAAARLFEVNMEYYVDFTPA
jgi:hypothetical protein